MVETEDGTRKQFLFKSFGYKSGSYNNLVFMVLSSKSISTELLNSSNSG